MYISIWKIGYDEIDGGVISIHDTLEITIVNIS